MSHNSSRNLTKAVKDLVIVKELLRDKSTVGALTDAMVSILDNCIAALSSSEENLPEEYILPSDSLSIYLPDLNKLLNDGMKHAVDFVEGVDSKYSVCKVTNLTTMWPEGYVLYNCSSGLYSNHAYSTVDDCLKVEGEKMGVNLGTPSKVHGMIVLYLSKSFAGQSMKE